MQIDSLVGDSETDSLEEMKDGSDDEIMKIIVPQRRTVGKLAFMFESVDEIDIQQSAAHAEEKDPKIRKLIIESTLQSK